MDDLIHSVPADIMWKMQSRSFSPVHMTAVNVRKALKRSSLTTLALRRPSQADEIKDSVRAW